MSSSLLFVAMVLNAGVAAAQNAVPRASSDTVSYVYLKGTDTVAIERIVRKTDGVRGELSVKAQPRVVWMQHVNAGNSVGAFDLDAYAAIATPNALPIQRVTLRIAGDSGYMDIHADSLTTTPQKLKLPAGTQWMLNTSVLHTDVLASIALQHKQSEMNIVLAQGGQQFKMSVRGNGDTTFTNLAGSDIQFVHDAAGLKEAILAGNLRVVRASASDNQKLTAKTTAEKISYAAPAGAPYTAEDVTITTSAGFRLAGTLTRPRGVAKPAVVVTITGSGEQERDSRLPGVNGYAIFREIADTLGRRGIAVLRVDDRGVGASTGRESRAVATSADYAADVREVVKYLRTRKDIDTTRIALVGHSEGGMIAPMVASQDKGIRAIALLAGPAYTGRRVMMFQNQDAVNQIKQFNAAQRDSIMKTVPARLDSIGIVSPWIGFFMQHDPLKTARLVSQPVLILQGGTDHQVTPEQSDTLAIAFREAGNKDVTVRLFPATDHLFLADSVGVATGYTTLPDTHIRKTVLGVIADWFVAKLK